MMTKERQTYDETYDSLEWVLPMDAFNIQHRPVIQAVRFTVFEGTHTLRVRGNGWYQDTIYLDWSKWNEITWTLTLEE